MKTLVFLLLAVVTLIHCQDQDPMTVFPLQGILEKLEGISDRLKGYEAIQQKQDEIMDQLMDVQEKLGSLETNIQELHHELEHVKGGHLEIKSFVHKEISGIISLAEKDECSEGSPPCGHFGICHNTLFSFTCSCPSGFTWDGSDCADIDECAEDKGICDPNATCKNSIGSYNCSCNKPFEGDGVTSCEFHCRNPDKDLTGLGCIRVVEEKMTFPNMSDFCHEEGGRLVQNFDDQLLTDIEYIFGRWPWDKWVGVYDAKWPSDESHVPEDLWWRGHRLDPSKRCGVLITDSSTSSLRLAQIPCSRKRGGLCQFQLPLNGQVVDDIL